MVLAQVQPARDDLGAVVPGRMQAGARCLGADRASDVGQAERRDELGVEAHEREWRLRDRDGGHAGAGPRGQRAERLDLGGARQRPRAGEGAAELAHHVCLEDALLLAGVPVGPRVRGPGGGREAGERGRGRAEAASGAPSPYRQIEPRAGPRGHRGLGHVGLPAGQRVRVVLARVVLDLRVALQQAADVARLAVGLAGAELARLLREAGGLVDHLLGVRRALGDRAARVPRAPGLEQAGADGRVRAGRHAHARVVDFPQEVRVLRRAVGRHRGHADPGLAALVEGEAEEARRTEARQHALALGLDDLEIARVPVQRGDHLRQRGLRVARAGARPARPAACSRAASRRRRSRRGTSPSRPSPEVPARRVDRPPRSAGTRPVAPPSGAR